MNQVNEQFAADCHDILKADPGPDGLEKVRQELEKVLVDESVTSLDTIIQTAGHMTTESGGSGLTCHIGGGTFIYHGDATEAVTIPRGANHPRNNFWGPENGRPSVATPTARGRTTTISMRTQLMPPQPRGLSSAQDTSAASKGNSMVIASCASS